MILLLLLISTLIVALPAEAAFCRTLNQHSICILSIKRSAKNYWEYRASVSIDGTKHPIEIYNCRDRVKIQNDGTPIPFQPSGAGELICYLLNRR